MIKSKQIEKYEDLEKQGLLLRLPCKVGTKVYAIIKIIDYGEVGDEATYSYSIIEREFQIYMMMENAKLSFGKTVFLTKDEAEQKLKEMNTDNGIAEQKEKSENSYLSNGGEKLDGKNKRIIYYTKDREKS